MTDTIIGGPANTEFTSELPIHGIRDKIVSAVDTNQVVVITAETGAGKSTQVPQYLAEHGYKKVIVTQPRILAARNLSNRVREEWAIRTGENSKPVIGYRTAHERDDDPENKIMYCTDGLQLVREITGSGTTPQQVLILDEVHEWNENMEVLIAWAKKRCQESPDFKVVIMSATIEVSSLAEYFNTEAVISVEGRSFGVTKRMGTNVVDEIVNQLESTSNNVLVFLPGKAEIENVTSMIEPKANEKHVPIIPLHSQLETEDQQKAFASYPQGKIILSTNIAQTSVTIEDIDTVIDSGLERRAEVRNGVEGLFLAQVSQADCSQRAGRTGRTKTGEYILAPLDEMPCLTFDERPDYGTPEILRKHIDRLTLRLANIGMDIEDLEFFHSPSHKSIKNAKRTLISLGALTTDHKVTNTGRQMEQFPVESSYARMLVEAKPYSDEVQAKLAVIIAIQEVNGITKNSARYSTWKHYTKQKKSDLLAQYDVYLALPTIDEEMYEEIGIIAKNVSKAEEVIERLHDDLKLPEIPTRPIKDEEAETLMRCIVAGQTHLLWTVEQNGDVIHISNHDIARRLSGGTVVSNPTFIAGIPFDLEIPTPSGELETLHLVQGITVVKPEWLKELAPESFSIQTGKVYYDNQLGTIVRGQEITFNGQTIRGEGSPITERSTRNKRLFSDLYAEWVYKQLQNERKSVERAAGHRIGLPAFKQVQHRVRSATYGAISLNELGRDQRSEIERLGRLQSYTPKRLGRFRRNRRTDNHDQHDDHIAGDKKHKMRWHRNRR